MPHSRTPPFDKVRSFPVEVRAAGADKGLGVFATRKIKRGEFCCWYDGIMCGNYLNTLLITGEHGYAQETNRGWIAGIRTPTRPGGVARATMVSSVLKPAIDGQRAGL